MLFEHQVQFILSSSPQLVIGFGICDVLGLRLHLFYSINSGRLSHTKTDFFLKLEYFKKVPIFGHFPVFFMNEYLYQSDNCLKIIKKYHGANEILLDHKYCISLYSILGNPYEMCDQQYIPKETKDIKNIFKITLLLDTFSL